MMKPVRTALEGIPVFSTQRYWKKQPGVKEFNNGSLEDFEKSISLLKVKENESQRYDILMAFSRGHKVE